MLLCPKGEQIPSAGSIPGRKTENRGVEAVLIMYKHKDMHLKKKEIKP